MKWWRGVAFAFALAGFAWPRASHAEDERAVAGERVVRIQVDGDATALARTRAVASELLGRLGLSPIVTARQPETDAVEAPGQRALARAYFDLRDPRTPGIVVVDPETEREVVRRTLPDSASLEIAVEQLSHVLYAVVEALSQTARSRQPARTGPMARPGPPSRPEPRQAPPPAPPREEPAPAPTVAPPSDDAGVRPPRGDPSAPSLTFGAFARLLTIDSSSLLPGGGLSLAARSREDGLAFGGTVTGALHTSQEIFFEGARGRVRPLSLRAYGTVSGPTQSRVLLVAGFGGGVDVFRVEADSAPPDAAAQSSTISDVILGTSFGARFPIAGALGLDAAFTLDLDLSPRHFVAEQGDRRVVLLELGRFRPAFVLGASYSLTGSSQATRSRP